MNFETKLAPARALLFGSLLFAIVACSGKPAPTSPTPTVAADAAPAQPLAADSTSWTPEALEDLLAPVALYPDPVLAQLLVAVTNPQEVLDAGNWLIAHPDLKGKPLDTAAQAAGFTLTMRSVMQFPEVVDKLCMNMPWTEELGQAYVNDQQGVMDAVQRLRAQAQSVGTLKSSPQMKVTTEKQAGGDVIALEPAKPNVVAVPQYDPVIVYAQPPAPAATTTTTTTTTTKEDEGHSTESMIATGVLAFGAGLLVSEIFDDDDYYNHGYYGNMWHGPMPYYPPYPYRPAYGGGYYPGNAYNRPNNYVRNGNTVIINNNNNYFDRYNSPTERARTRQQPSSPITAARPNRPELQQLNAKAAQGPVRGAPSTSEALRGKGGYTGNDPKVKQTMDRQASQGAVNKSAAKAAPKVQGTYAGAKPDRAKPAAAARPATASTPQRDAARPAQAQRSAETNRPNADRGYAGDARASPRPDAQRPDLQGPSTPAVRPQPQANRSAMSGGGGGSYDHAASARGRQSMPSGGAAKARAKPRRR